MRGDRKKLKEELKSKEKKISIIIVAVVVTIVIIDQILKIVILRTDGISIIDGILNFNVSKNISNTSDISSRLMDILTHVIILGIIFKFIRTQNEFIDTKLKVILSFILAGGFSNLIDRIFRGYVVEFIDFTQVIKLPIFNIADIFVLIGWIGFAAIFASFTVEELNKNKKIKEKKN